MPDEAPTPDAPKPEAKPETGAPPKDLTAEVEKWKSLSRQNEAKAKENAKAAERLAELEEAGKTEVERAQARAEAAEKERDSATAHALRLEVAAEKGLTLKQARRLVGTTREELEADAEDLLETFPEAPPAEPDSPPPNGRPKERMKPGAIPTVEVPVNRRHADLLQMEKDIKAGSRH